MVGGDTDKLKEAQDEENARPLLERGGLRLLRSPRRHQTNQDAVRAHDQARG